MRHLPVHIRKWHSKFSRGSQNPTTEKSDRQIWGDMPRWLDVASRSDGVFGLISAWILPDFPRFVLASKRSLTAPFTAFTQFCKPVCNCEINWLVRHANKVARPHSNIYLIVTPPLVCYSKSEQFSVLIPWGSNQFPNCYELIKIVYDSSKFNHCPPQNAAQNWSLRSQRAY